MENNTTNTSTDSTNDSTSDDVSGKIAESTYNEIKALGEITEPKEVVRVATKYMKDVIEIQRDRDRPMISIVYRDYSYFSLEFHDDSKVTYEIGIVEPIKERMN